jgi:pseudomonalisin
LWSGGGGASSVYAKPGWQLGPGVLPDGKRDVPDLSLSAAGHDGYLIYINGGLNVVGGTSAAAPAFAGIMALVVQSTATRQGNANAAFYNLASKQASGGPPVFHDVTTGNNSVPGVPGFYATPGYDSATGLGSLDAMQLLAHWDDAIIVPSIQISVSSGSFSVATNSNTTLNLSSTVSGGFNAAVAFAVTGLPAGVTAAFTPPSLPAPGSGPILLNFAASGAAKAGTYPVNLIASSGGISKAIALTLTVTVPPKIVERPVQHSTTHPR